MAITMPASGMPAISRSQTVRNACQRWREAGLALLGHTEAIVLTCQAIARRFHQGGTLIAFGNGASSTDAHSQARTYRCKKNNQIWHGYCQSKEVNTSYVIYGEALYSIFLSIKSVYSAKV